MRKFLWAALLAALFIPQCRAADIPVFPTGPVFKLTPAPTWGVTGPQGFNNNFFFTPLSQNESVCVFVKNNNTTSAHSFTATISVNSDPQNTTPSDGTWQVGASSTGLFAAASPGQPAGIGVSVSGSAQVSVNFSASTTQAGSPETANIVIVQSTGNCFSGNQFVGSAPSTLAAVPVIQAISEGLSQAFSVFTQITNPAGGQDLLAIQANATSKTIYLDRLILTATAAAQVNLLLSATTGATCTVPGFANLKFGSTVPTTATLQQTCTTHPGGSFTFSQISIPAGQTVVIDLRGIIVQSGTTNGLDVSAITFTGTIGTTIFWYEK